MGRNGLSTRIVAVAAMLASVSVAGACGSDAGNAADTGPTPNSAEPAAPAQIPAPVQVLDISGEEYAFDITPDPETQLRPGWTEVNFHNVGVEPHQVMFARIKDGVDMADLAEAGAGDSSGSAAIEFVDMIGGVSYIGAGNETTALVNLPEGTVMAMCYVPDPHGVAHALMGMSAMLTVSKSAPAPAVPELGPEPVAGTIDMSADGYAFPDDMRSGWYRVTNTDDALHELSLLGVERELDGDELDQLIADLAVNKVPDVNLEAVGGMGAVSAGFEGYLHLDLDPGHYVAVDFMPDPGDPRPHMLDGYYGSFTIGSE